MRKKSWAWLAIGFFLFGTKGIAAATTITDLGEWKDPKGITHWYQAYTDPGSSVSFSNKATYGSLMLWDTAKTTAESMTHRQRSGHLATFTSSAENSAVWDMVTTNGLTGLSFWLGGYQDRITDANGGETKSPNAANWHWVTGETWDTEAALWASDADTIEPNDSRWARELAADGSIAYTRDERYLQWYRRYADGRWNDVSHFTTGTGNSTVSGETYSFIVEYETPHPVPEPATMLLFGSGLVALTGISRRRKKTP